MTKPDSTQTRTHVAFLLGPFPYPTRQDAIADELRARGWRIAEQLDPDVDIIVIGAEPTVATCGGTLDSMSNESANLFARQTGREMVAWSTLSVQLLCDDLRK